MILKRIFSRKPDPVRPLYEAIVAAARQPVHYVEHSVPDTLDGRFDMITLHMFLVLERLQGQGGNIEHVRQQLIDGFFLDMDRNLREMGVGDLSVGKKVRKMAEVFYGRMKAYSEADETNLEPALARNIYSGVVTPQAAKLANWVHSARSMLARQPVSDILMGRPGFP